MNTLSSEEIYKLLFESSPQPMLLYDIETLKILAINNAAVNLYGYSLQEFLSMTINDIHLLENIPLDFSSNSAPGGTKILQQKKKDCISQIEMSVVSAI